VAVRAGKKRAIPTVTVWGVPTPLLDRRSGRVRLGAKSSSRRATIGQERPTVRPQRTIGAFQAVGRCHRRTPGPAKHRPKTPGQPGEQGKIGHTEDRIEQAGDHVQEA